MGGTLTFFLSTYRSDSLTSCRLGPAFLVLLLMRHMQLCAKFVNLRNQKKEKRCEWTCNTCTLLNLAQNRKCVMCGDLKKNASDKILKKQNNENNHQEKKKKHEKKKEIKYEMNKEAKHETAKEKKHK